MSVIRRNIGDREYRCCQGIDFSLCQGGGLGAARLWMFDLGHKWGGV